MRLIVLTLLLSSCSDPCRWQIERGFDDEYHAFTAECLYDHHRARDSEELCQLKAVSRGLVKWTCEK